MIQGCDNWETSQREEPEPEIYCVECGAQLEKRDALYTINGWMCGYCLEDLYGEMV